MPSKIPASDPRDEMITHLPAMRAFALSLTRNGTRADDLVQDAIVKAWKGFDSFKPGTNPACMALYDPSKYVLLREAKREVADVDGAFSSRLASKPDHDGRLAFKDFQAAFETLPDEQREALVLVGASGFSYEEAA